MSQEKSKQALAAAFKSQRKTLKLTQKGLADHLGVSTVHISYIENGTRLPSRKLLKKIFELSGEEIPAEILDQLSETKAQVAVPPVVPDTIYDLKAKGLFSTKALKHLFKEEPQNMIYAMGLFHLYKDKGELKKAKQVLMSAQAQIQRPEHQKWLEAYSYQIQNTYASYIKALHLMAESLQIFEDSHDALDSAQRKAKSELLFRYATIHFDFGVYLFFHLSPTASDDRAEIKSQFKKALEKHQILRQYYLYPYSQMDYANIHYWLATLMHYETTPDQVAEKVLWKTFIEESKAAIFLNYSEKLSHFPRSTSQDLFTPEFMLLNVSFLALAHGRLALLEPAIDKMKEHLKQAELFWATHSLEPLKSPHVKYRYYYNFAHFYSIKAQILHEFSLEDSASQTATFLNLSAKAMQEAQGVDPAAFALEAQLPSELSFYKSQRPHEFQKLIGVSE